MEPLIRRFKRNGMTRMRADNMPRALLANFIPLALQEPHDAIQAAMLRRFKSRQGRLRTTHPFLACDGVEPTRINEDAPF